MLEVWLKPLKKEMRALRNKLQEKLDVLKKYGTAFEGCTY
jgi:hypothetical protein